LTLDMLGPNSVLGLSIAISPQHGHVFTTCPIIHPIWTRYTLCILLPHMLWSSKVGGRLPPKMRIVGSIIKFTSNKSSCRSHASHKTGSLHYFHQASACKPRRWSCAVTVRGLTPSIAGPALLWTVNAIFANSLEALGKA
jgi:hypothetical protein